MKISNEVRVAILAILAIFIFVYGFNYLKGKDLFSRTNYYYAIYDDVGGLGKSAIVTVNGYNVGSVTNLELTDNLKIIVELSLEHELSLPKDAVVDIYSPDPLSGKAVRLVYAGKCSSNCAKSGDTLKGQTTGLVASLTGDMSESLNDAKDALSGAVSAGLDSLNKKFASEGEAIGDSFNDIQSILKNLKRSTGKLDKLLEGSTDNIKKTLDNLQLATSNLKTTKEQLDRVLNNAETFTVKVNEIDLKGTLNKTMGGVDDAVSQATNTLKKADDAIASVDDLMKKVKDGSGSIAELMNDEAKLYNNLNEATLDLQLLLQDVRLNPKRYIRLFRKKSPEYALPADDPARGE